MLKTSGFRLCRAETSNLEASSHAVATGTESGQEVQAAGAPGLPPRGVNFSHRLQLRLRATFKTVVESCTLLQGYVALRGGPETRDSSPASTLARAFSGGGVLNRAGSGGGIQKSGRRPGPDGRQQPRASVPTPQMAPGQVWPGLAPTSPTPFYQPHTTNTRASHVMSNQFLNSCATVLQSVCISIFQW